MTRNFILLLLFPLLLISCAETEKEEAPLFDLSLNDSEKEGGVMTPEILWKFGRIGSIALSPDAGTVLYTVTSYDIPTEESKTNIFSLPVSGSAYKRGWKFTFMD